jgi:hypothetical protein
MKDYLLTNKRWYLRRTTVCLNAAVTLDINLFVESFTKELYKNQLWYYTTPTIQKKVINEHNIEHWPAASWIHLTWVRFELTTLVVVSTDSIGSFKSHYHTITTTMIPRKSCSASASPSDLPQCILQNRFEIRWIQLALSDSLKY